MSTKFNIVKKGYDPSEVDQYIETMEAVIKSYKEKDAAIKNAILNAQIAADNIILNAKNRSYEIKENSIVQIKEIIESVSAQRTMMKEFESQYMALVEKYLHKVEKEDLKKVSQKIDALESYLNKFTAMSEDTPKSSSNANPPAQPHGKTVSVQGEEADALKDIFKKNNFHS